VCAIILEKIHSSLEDALRLDHGWEAIADDSDVMVVLERIEIIAMTGLQTQVNAELLQANRQHVVSTAITNLSQGSSELPQYYEMTRDTYTTADAIGIAMASDAQNVVGFYQGLNSNYMQLKFNISHGIVTLLLDLDAMYRVALGYTITQQPSHHVQPRAHQAFHAHDHGRSSHDGRSSGRGRGRPSQARSPSPSRHRTYPQAASRNVSFPRQATRMGLPTEKDTWKLP
jgi:hypothetical protein